MKSIAQNKQIAVASLYISIGIILYWIITRFVNVYDYILIGALYEMTALIVAAATFVIPVLIMVLAISNKFRINPNYYIGLGVLALTIILIFTVFN